MLIESSTQISYSTVDEPLPRAVLDGLQTILALIGSIAITLILNPYILIPVLVMSVPFFYIRKIYLKTAKNIKRIEGVGKTTAHIVHKFTNHHESLHALIYYFQRNHQRSHIWRPH